MKQILIIFLFLSLTACVNNTSSTKEDVILAKVDREYLYLSEVPITSESDSLANVEQYRKDWIKKHLLLIEAKDHVNIEEIDKKVKTYRESLIWSEYQNLLLENTNFDVSEEDINKHYAIAKENFVTQTDQYEVQFYILNADMDISQVKTALNSTSVPQPIQNYCSNNPLLCRTERGHWFVKDELQRLTNIPDNSIYKTSNFASHNIDANHIVVYRINTIIKKGNILPLSMVKDKVEALAAYQKKQDLIEEVTERTYQTGKTNEIFEIYNN